MSIIEPGGAPGAASNIVSRAQGLILTPTAEWQKIEPEASSVQGIYTGWLAPLALIPAIAMFVGMTVFGVGVPGLAVVKLSMVDGAIRAVVQFLTLLGMTYVMGLVIDALATNFGGQKNPLQAFKVAAYSAVGFCLASVFQIIPALGILGLLGLYSIFILHKGLPVLMKSAPDKTTGYTASVVAIMFVAWIVVAAISGALMPMRGANPFAAGFPGASRSESSNASVEINGTKVDISALERAAKQMEEAAKSGEGITITAGAVDGEALKGLLPERIGGFTRTEISTGGAAGMGGASAKYENGDKRLDVSLVDMGSMGALGSLAGAANVQSSTENADGYERVRTVDGRMTIEKYSRASNSAEYGQMIANRFMLTVDGRNVSPEEVKGAFDAIGPARLEAMAKN
jgi:hypothetical protein